MGLTRLWARRVNDTLAFALHVAGPNREMTVAALPRSYPTDQVGRQQLADELAALELKPTQAKQSFDPDKINRMAEAMSDGSFGWYKASLQPVILGPAGEVLGGHHRVIAAYLAGIDLASVPGGHPQVQVLPKNFRPVFDWIDVLPDVP